MRSAPRTGSFAAVLVAVATACSSNGNSVVESPAPPVATTPSPERSALAWERVDARGPSARRDYSLTADANAGILYLFGGRAGGKALGDLWALDAEGARWTRLAERGPAPRFGHNAAFLGGRLVVFGGQGGPGRFFNDVWAFDPAAKRWSDVSPKGDEPAPRYGAGGASAGRRFIVTHGFTDSGRFDDTWSLGAAWKDVTPREGRRPIKRCLTRAVYLAATRHIVMFGGQTDGTPFLGDTWLFEPILSRWREVTQGDKPEPRNLYAAAATRDALYMFGGFGAKAPLRDLWSFTGKRWRKLSPDGPAPAARGGIEAAVLGERMFVFGGANGSGELADLWALSVGG
jgi:hypothetical protein